MLLVSGMIILMNLIKKIQTIQLTNSKIIKNKSIEFLRVELFIFIFSLFLLCPY